MSGKLLESFHAEEVAVEASWRPKWTATGPVVLIEPDDNEDLKDLANDTGDGGFESEEELQPAEEAEVVAAEKIAGTVLSIVGRSQTRTLHRVGEVYITLVSRFWEMNLPRQAHIIGLARTAWQRCSLGTRISGGGKRRGCDIVRLNGIGSRSLGLRSMRSSRRSGPDCTAGCVAERRGVRKVRFGGPKLKLDVGPRDFDVEVRARLLTRGVIESYPSRGKVAPGAPESASR